MQKPQYFEYLNHAKILSGKRSLEHLPLELKGYDAQKPLVISGTETGERGLLKHLVGAFADSGVVIGAVFNGVKDYASITMVRDLALLFRDRGCDSIIAVGGCPVVDVAKGVNILVSEKTDDLFRYIEGAPVAKHLKPLIYVPTSCSTGMEMTNTMTIDNRRMTSDILYPDILVIDPRMTPGCCAECIAESAVIALAHAVESTLDQAGNPMVEASAHTALQFLAGHMTRGMKKPKKREAGLALANASAMAAIAFSNAPAGMAHLLAEELSMATGISIGASMRIIMAASIAGRLAGKGKISDQLLLGLGGFELYAATPAKDRGQRGAGLALGLLAATKGLLPGSFKAMNLPKYKLAEVAEAAAAKSGKRYSAAECLQVLEKAWDGAAV